MAFGMEHVVVGAMAGRVAGGMVHAVAGSMADGVADGVAGGVAGGVVRDVTVGVADGVVGGVAGGVVSLWLHRGFTCSEKHSGLLMPRLSQHHSFLSFMALCQEVPCSVDLRRLHWKAHQE